MVLIFMMQTMIFLVSILLAVAFFSLFERKLMGYIQLRKGPNKVSFMGILQPISDAMKLLTKTDQAPISSPSVIFFITPVMFMVVSLCYWMPLPINGNWLIFQSGALFIIFCMSIPVYMIIFLGWFSNSKYSMIGSVRSVIQTISYEIAFSFMLFSECLMCYSINLIDFLKFQEFNWLMIPLLPMVIPMVISMLAETNRTPFDLTEGESELVSGFCVEYGGLSYTLVFLSENASIMFMTVFMSVLMTNMSIIMTTLMIINYVWIRATLPRIRFDKLMMMCWVFILPFVMCMMMSIIIIL